MCDPDPSEERLKCNMELQGKNGEARNDRIEDGGSGHSERSGREGNAGGGPEEDGLPWPDAVALEHQLREDCARAPTKTEQPVGQNYPEGPGSVDGGYLEKGLRFLHPGRRYGDANGAICRRKVCQPTSSQGRIPVTGMQGSESKADAGVRRTDPLPKEASEGDGNSWQHNLWSIH